MPNSRSRSRSSDTISTSRPAASTTWRAVSSGPGVRRRHDDVGPSVGGLLAEPRPERRRPARLPRSDSGTSMSRSAMSRTSDRAVPGGVVGEVAEALTVAEQPQLLQLVVHGGSPYPVALAGPHDHSGPTVGGSAPAVGTFAVVGPCSTVAPAPGDASVPRGDAVSGTVQPSETTGRRSGVLDVPLGTATRPSWRGRIHLLALDRRRARARVPGRARRRGRARAGVVVYAAGLCSMFAVSTTYHRWVHTMRSRAIWRRADHATIYAAIAATCTPLCLALLATGPAVAMLVRHLDGGLIGAAVTLTRWRRANVVASGHVHRQRLDRPPARPGAAADRRCGPDRPARRRRPDLHPRSDRVRLPLAHLRPSVFSYHEVWHLCTLAAAASHVAVVWLVVA